MDVRATATIRRMKLCRRECPAFSTCIMMPLSVLPKDWRARRCLVADGPPWLKELAESLTTGGHSGIVNQIQKSILMYGKVLQSTKELSDKERLRYTKDLNAMLQALAKMVPEENGKSPDDDRVEIDTGELPADPESLAYSDKIKEILPSMDVMPVEERPVPEEPKKRELADPITEKFFPMEE